MKVILLDHVEHLGLPGQIANVKDGYFRNYLGPRRLAVEATEANLRGLQGKQRKLKEAAARIIGEAQTLADQLKGRTVEFIMKVAESNRLYGSVGPGDIAEKLAELGFNIERRRIALPGPIKTTGTFTATIRLQPTVATPITIVVTAEEPPASEAGPARETEAQAEAASEAAGPATGSDAP